MAELDRIERELRENLASFDAEVAFELANEGERADLWTEIDVPVESIRLLLEALAHLRAERDELRKALERIAGGSFDNAGYLAIDGRWHEFTNRLQEIASRALSTREKGQGE